MIDKIRIGVDMLDPKGPLNDGESQLGVRILCATNTVGRSEDPRAITYQVEKKFHQIFQLGIGRYIGELGEVYATTTFGFGKLQASAHAIVCHLDGDMRDQNYSQARNGLRAGLDRIHQHVALTGEKKQMMLDSHIARMQELNPNNTDAYLSGQERLIRETRLRINPIMRIPLMASGSPDDCAELFRVMEDSRANLVVYMLAQSRDIVKATLVKFPALRNIIVPAMDNEELQLAA